MTEESHSRAADISEVPPPIEEKPFEPESSGSTSSGGGSLPLIDRPPFDPEDEES